MSVYGRKNEELIWIFKDYEQILDGMSSYDRIVELWNWYAKKNEYVNDIKVEEIVNELKEFILNLDIKVVTA